MMKDTPSFNSRGTNVGIGEYRVGNSPMTVIGLGSCIALILHDSRRKTGAVAHVMLPASNGNRDRPGKFADTAVPVLLDELKEQGSNCRSVTARLVGGASMFRNFNGSLNIGERNAEALRVLLADHRIPIELEEVGGNTGRSVLYRPLDEGRIYVKRADGSCNTL
jgi:chemotaxis protein CheD